MKSFRLLLILAGLAVAPSALSWTVEDELDAVVRASMKEHMAPGASLAVIRDGSAPVIRSYGIANLEQNTPVTPRTVFRVASLSKQFAAMAALLMVSDGKLSLEDPVAKHLSEAPATWSGMTVRHLLTHTSGIADPEGFNYRLEYSEANFIELVGKKKLDTEPGAAYRYNNFAYATLGILIGRVAGKPMRQVVKERIFDRIGLSETRYFTVDEVIPSRAAGYEVVDGKSVNAQPLRPQVFDASGGILTTIGDLVKYDAALRQGEFPPRAMLEQQWTPAKLKDGTEITYGLGWNVLKENGRRVVRHGGDTMGFTAYIIRDLDKKTTVILLRNTGEGKAFDAAKKIHDLVTAGTL